MGKLDIKTMVQANGSEYLPDAIPLTCEPGDVTIVNRQLLHGSFVNTSPNLRVSLTFGFHRRQAVLGARGALSQAAGEVYEEQRIFERACVIPVAIDARSQFYPSQSPFDYLPFAGLTDKYGYNDETKASVIQDYNLKDLSIWEQ
jgi:ectoine hydroxylase-related dioxygenase (phytanoyl-CoA dioxygenase family)